MGFFPKANKKATHRKKRPDGFSRWALGLDFEIHEQGLRPMTGQERWELQKHWHPGRSAKDSIRELQQMRAKQKEQPPEESYPLSGPALAEHINKQLEEHFKDHVRPQKQKAPRILK